MRWKHLEIFSGCVLLEAAFSKQWSHIFPKCKRHVFWPKNQEQTSLKLLQLGADPSVGKGVPWQIGLTPASLSSSAIFWRCPNMGVPGYPKMDGWFRGTPILGKLHIIKPAPNLPEKGSGINCPSHHMLQYVCCLNSAAWVQRATILSGVHKFDKWTEPDMSQDLDFPCTGLVQSRDSRNQTIVGMLLLVREAHKYSQVDRHSSYFLFLCMWACCS